MKDKKVGNVLKTESKVIAYVVICLVIIVLGISYALFFEVKGNEKNQIVKAGTLEFTYANGSQMTNATNSDCFIPMNSEEALKHSECEYKISITNTGTLPGNYNINLNSESVENPLALNKLKVILKKEGQVVSDYPKEGTTTSLVENEKIEAGKVVNYTVQVYVDKELVDANDDEKNISLIINGDAIVNSEEVNPIDTSLAINYIKNITTVENGDGLYTVAHDVSEISKEWNKIEYRYAGINPNNYVSFNNEIWRIIGLVNVKTENGIEQRIKIIRLDGINDLKDFGKYAWDRGIEYTNNWVTSKLKDMLNGIYYESSIGSCWKENSETSEVTCDFTGNGVEPKGLKDVQNMIDNDVKWNIGGTLVGNILANRFYEKERGTLTGNDNEYPYEWSQENDNNYNGVGLMYPSDYGYAVGGDVREKCLLLDLNMYHNNNCCQNDWLSSNSQWLLITFIYDNAFNAFNLNSYDGRVYWDVSVNNYIAISPVVYLKTSVKILPNPKSNQEYGSIDNPFVLQ